MNLLKKQFVKRNYHKETLKITIDMAWPAIVESFFVAFAGLIDSLMVSSLGSYAVAAVGLTTQPKLLGLALFFALNVAISALVARRRGEKKQDSANEILLTAVLFIGCISLRFPDRPFPLLLLTMQGYPQKCQVHLPYYLSSGQEEDFADTM